MGCASSGPAKDLAAAATNGTEHLKTAVGTAMEDAANLDFAKAEEDLKQVGEGLKDAIKEGVNDLMEDVMGKRPSSMEGREDGDGGSMKENNSEESPSDPAEPTEDKAGTTEETPATEPEAASDEQGLDAIPQETMEKAAEAMGVGDEDNKGGEEQNGENNNNAASEENANANDDDGGSKAET